MKTKRKFILYILCGGMGILVLLPLLVAMALTYVPVELYHVLVDGLSIYTALVTLLVGIGIYINQKNLAVRQYEESTKSFINLEPVLIDLNAMTFGNKEFKQTMYMSRFKFSAENNYIKDLKVSRSLGYDVNTMKSMSEYFDNHDIHPRYYFTPSTENKDRMGYLSLYEDEMSPFELYIQGGDGISHNLKGISKVGKSYTLSLTTNSAYTVMRFYLLWIRLQCANKEINQKERKSLEDKLPSLILTFEFFDIKLQKTIIDKFELKFRISQESHDNGKGAYSLYSVPERI